MSFVKVKIKNSATVATTARRALVVAFGVTALSFGSANVWAADPLPQKEVSLVGLDLSQPADASQAYSRIAAAAKDVCRQLAIREQAGLKRVQQCFKQSLANAVKAVDNEQLTRLHQSDRNVRMAQRSSNRADKST